MKIETYVQRSARRGCGKRRASRSVTSYSIIEIIIQNCISHCVRIVSNILLYFSLRENCFKHFIYGMKEMDWKGEKGKKDKQMEPLGDSWHVVVYYTANV